MTENDKLPWKPSLAMCNLFENPGELRAFALKHCFSGIDWSFDLEQLPKTPAQESRWVKDLAVLRPLAVRFHCPFYQMDLGHEDPREAKKAETLFRRITRLVSKGGGEYLSIHIGLGHDSTEPLSWNGTIGNLRRLVQFGAERRVKICLENLAWGWTSKPHLFEKLIRKSGAAVTFDIGHAVVCDTVRCHEFEVEDFVTPHAERVLSAHIYHEEISGVGHTAPESLGDMEERLALLHRIRCPWWVIEIREVDGLLRTKKIIDEFLALQE